MNSKGLRRSVGRTEFCCSQYWGEFKPLWIQNGMDYCKERAVADEKGVLRGIPEGRRI